MKYELETIPIWDAYRAGGECPLCFLQERAEAGYIDFFLGNSVMVPEMRVKVNSTGFCRDHFKQMLDSRKNRHGLGLITHTHFKTRLENFKKFTARGNNPDKAFEGAVKGFCTREREEQRTCMICERIEYTVKRYSFTIVYLWKKDAEFRQAMSASNGFCFGHLPHVFDMALEIHSRKDALQFIREVCTLSEKNFDRLEGELLWYTQKFDCQNDGKPWGTSRDALHRSIQKLTGKLQKEIT